MTEEQLTQDYITTELKRIEEDFHLLYYFSVSNYAVQRGIAYKLLQKAKFLKDKQTLNFVIKYKNLIDSLCLLAENFEQMCKTKNEAIECEKEATKSIFKQVNDILGITAATLRYERINEFAGIMTSFNQGQIAQVKDELLDSLLDYEETNTLEGFGLAQKYLSDKSVDEKESFCKDLVKWANFRNMKQ